MLFEPIVKSLSSPKCLSRINDFWPLIYFGFPFELPPLGKENTHHRIVLRAFTPATHSQQGHERGVDLLQCHESVKGAVVAALVRTQLIPGIQNLKEGGKEKLRTEKVRHMGRDRETYR